MRVDPESLRAYARSVASASDVLIEMDSFGLWASAAVACKGTAMVDGFSTHAENERDVVRNFSDGLDALACALKATADVFDRADDSIGESLDSAMIDRQ